MTDHERSPIVNRAGLEILKAVLDIAALYELTPLEELEILASCMAQVTKYALRAERHHDPAKPLRTNQPKTQPKPPQPLP